MKSKRVRARKIFNLLAEQYPGAETALKYADPFQLFVAVVLSARTTDGQVNRSTAKLFPRAGTPQMLAQMEESELEQYIRGCGLYRQKSRYLIAASRIIMEKHGGQVPDSYEQLIDLPGAGRKTANVLLNSAFRKDALAVDTHVYRVSKRLGLASGDRLEIVEEELKSLLPSPSWGAAHYRLIAHGRKVCVSRRPLCTGCVVRQYCPSKQTS